MIGLYKAECVRHGSPRSDAADDLELRILTWVHWFNHTRLHGALVHVPPVEFEQAHYRQNTPAQQPLPENSTSTEPSSVTVFEHGRIRMWQDVIGHSCSRPTAKSRIAS